MNILDITMIFFNTLYSIDMLKLKRRAFLWSNIVVILVAFICLNSKLYNQFVLNMIYVIINTYAWITWGEDSSSNIKIKRIPKICIIYSSIIIILYTSWFGFITNKIDNIYAYADALVTVSNLVASYLLIKKVLESSYLYIFSDGLAIILFLRINEIGSVILYSTYVIFAILRLISWNKLMSKEILKEV